MTTISLSEGMPLIDDPNAPDIFVDALTGYFVLNDNVRLTFERARVNHAGPPGPLNRVVVGRMVMPLDAAERMARELLAFIEQVRSEAPGSPIPQSRPQ
jgi:hypothetical protein